jgi:hypothetical protein
VHAVRGHSFAEAAKLIDGLAVIAVHYDDVDDGRRLKTATQIQKLSNALAKIRQPGDNE